MSTIWRDYGERHAGVLGEADDLHFVRSGAASTEECLICWEWYLGSIMEGVAPARGGWTGLALEYHVGERWKGGEWELSDIPAAIEQLRGADQVLIERTPFGPTALDVLSDLLVFFEAAVAAGQSITVTSH
jgi:hypothetical protein